MNFHHLSLTRKLTIAFSILVAIIIGVSTLSVVSLSESSAISTASSAMNSAAAGWPVTCTQPPAPGLLPHATSSS